MNDAEASALGEWILCGKPEGVMLYIVMGTGVGAATVSDHEVTQVEFGHLTGFGPNRCGGCGEIGCLDAQIGGHTLPDPLTDQSIDMIVGILGKAVDRQESTINRVVVGGGIPRRYPQIVQGLQAMLNPPTYRSACPDTYKSAAHFGLMHAWQRLPRA